MHIDRSIIAITHFKLYINSFNTNCKNLRVNIMDKLCQRFNYIEQIFNQKISESKHSFSFSPQLPNNTAVENL